MSCQDWTTVTLKKTSKQSGGASTEQRINQARRRGEEVETMKRFMGGQNKSTKNIVPHAAKLDEDTGDYHISRVSYTFAKALQTARLDKKMTQAQLAQAVNEKPSVINDYEAGRAIPNGQLINRLNRVLGVRLPPSKQFKSEGDKSES